MLEQLKKLAEEGNTKIGSLSIEIESEGSLQELIEFFQNNKFEISKIHLDFAKGKLSLVERSKLTLDFLKIFHHVTGVQSFTLESTVKDYALEDILNHEAILKLTDFAFVHKQDSKDSKDMVNSTDFFENSLVTYLKKNQVLKSLTIEDYSETMTAKTYPKLKAAMIAHPRLVQFKNGAFSLNNDPLLLENDVQLVLSFVSKVQNNPVVMKATRAKEFNEAKESIVSKLSRIDEIFDLRKAVNPQENPWNLRIQYLNSGYKKWADLKTTYDQLTNEEADDLNQKKSIITVFCLYLKLLTKIAYLQSQKETVAYKNELEKMWDITRPQIWNNITVELQKETSDFSGSISIIQKEIDALQKIYDSVIPVEKQQKRALFSFPASYTALTEKYDDGLDKAHKLLQDYTKNNSALSRFFHGHWNRHHVAEVDNIVSRINASSTNAITSIAGLETALASIRLVNEEGSLARRIKFIEQHCHAAPSENNKQQMTTQNF